MKEKSVQLAQAAVAADIPDDLLRPVFFALLFIAFLSVRQLTFHKVNLD